MVADRPSPMEAKLVNALPVEPGWQYEPKWDGFRALVFREGEAVDILSKSGKPLGRYFPEIVALVASVPQERFVLDGEIILPIADILSFDALQARPHPAQSRIDRLAKETPAQLMLFDCLGVDDADLSMRRSRLAGKRWSRSMRDMPALVSCCRPVATRSTTLRPGWRRAGGRWTASSRNGWTSLTVAGNAPC